MARLEEVTRREEQWRERWLSLFLDHVPQRIHPDHFTQARLVLVIAAATLYLLHQDFRWQLALLITASLTDLVDGPLARRRGLVHAEGARLDQRADMLLGVWLGVLTLQTAALPVWVILALVFSQGLIWVVEAWGTRVETQRVDLEADAGPGSGSGAGSGLGLGSGSGERAVTRPSKALAAREGLTGFGTGPAPAKPNLASRAQFVLIIAGFLSVLSAVRLSWPLRPFGIACLVAAVLAALAQIYAKTVLALANGATDASHTKPPAAGV